MTGQLAFDLPGREAWSRADFYPSPANAEALAAAMHRVSQNPGFGDQLGAAGFRHAASTLNAHIQSVKLEDLLLSV